MQKPVTQGRRKAPTSITILMCLCKLLVTHDYQYDRFFIMMGLDLSTCFGFYLASNLQQIGTTEYHLSGKKWNFYLYMIICYGIWFLKIWTLVSLPRLTTLSSLMSRIFTHNKSSLNFQLNIIHLITII